MKRIFVAIFFICLVILSGCSKIRSTTPSTPANPILNKTISTMNQMKSYWLSTDLTRSYTVIQKSASSTFTDTWEWQSQRQVDLQNREVDLFMDIHETPQVGAPYVLWQYLIGGWDYRDNLSPPVYSGAGQINGWTKNKLNDGYAPLLSDESQLNAQIELLQSANNIDSFGTETINGLNYEIIQFSPSPQAAADWVLSQTGFDGPSLGWWFTTTERSKEIYVNALKSSSVKIWVDQNDYSLLKENISFSYDAVPGNVMSADVRINGDNVGFQHILVAFTGEWDFSNYNRQFEIQLPHDALSAQDETN